MVKIHRALVSVSDKRDLGMLVKHLDKHKIEIISTGGTLQKIQEIGIPVKSIGEFTKFPEMLDGRIKTLHPKVHGGILYMRDNEEHLKQISEHDIVGVDLVIVNLYPFVETISKANFTFEEAIENIDIGGPTMLRAAAKNHKFVTAVVDPDDYEKIINEMNDNDGAISSETRYEFARKVFNYTAAYDAAISAYLNDLQGEFKPNYLNLSFKKVQSLRYGENPHQRATLYADQLQQEGSLVSAEQIQGKELSFNNLLDFDSAVNIVQDFDETCVVIIKHNNPAGVAIGNENKTLSEIFQEAWSCDSISAFGSIIAINKEVDADTAEIIQGYFIEGVIAPSFSDEAKTILAKKKNLRLLQTKMKLNADKKFDVKRISGGLLFQDEDSPIYGESSLEVVTKIQPDEQQWQALHFAWKICKHTKSNAIVFSGPDKIYGVGSGQMSRIDSVHIAAEKARKFGHPLEDSVMASDAFFPFRDNIDEAAKFGIKAIIQPGGSIKDQEVIDACDEYGMAMVMTKMRHFRH